MTSARISTPIVLIGLALTLGVGSLPFPVWDHEFADVAHMVGNELIYWVLVVITLLYVKVIERRPVSSIGFRRPTVTDGVIALVAGVAILLGLWLLYRFLLPILHVSEVPQLNRLKSVPTWVLAMGTIRAGVAEEVLFRGYPIERLQEWTHLRVVSLGAPLVCFTLAHVGPWGWAHVIVAGFGGCMLTALYAWRRNLWASILAHCFVDGLAVLA